MRFVGSTGDVMGQALAVGLELERGDVPLAILADEVAVVGQPAVDGAGVDADCLGGGQSAAGLLVDGEHGVMPVALVPGEEGAPVVILEAAA